MPFWLALGSVALRVGAAALRLAGRSGARRALIRGARGRDVETRRVAKVTCVRVHNYYTNREVRAYLRNTVDRCQEATEASAKRWATKIVVGARDFGEGVKPYILASFNDPRWNRIQRDVTLYPRTRVVQSIMNSERKRMENRGRKRVAKEQAEYQRRLARRKAALEEGRQAALQLGLRKATLILFLYPS